MFALPHLSDLRLGYNALHDIELSPSGNSGGASCWDGVPSLTILDLSNNRCGAIPSGLLRLPRLTSLNLSNNEIKAVPPELGPRRTTHPRAHVPTHATRPRAHARDACHRARQRLFRRLLLPPSLPYSLPPLTCSHARHRVCATHRPTAPSPRPPCAVQASARSCRRCF